MGLGKIHRLADKLRIIDEYYTSGLSQADIAKKYSIHPRTLRLWVAKIKVDKPSKGAQLKLQLKSLTKTINSLVDQLKFVSIVIDEIVKTDLTSSKAQTLHQAVNNVITSAKIIEHYSEHFAENPPEIVETNHIYEEDTGKRDKFNWNE